ncbi:MAG: putative Na+/H+ antiporter [Oligoflexia bacterium]|nr:putative Na+/H+ antiporter [Oligoflexia bacterium]
MLFHRIQQDPFNLVATVIFLLAIIHTFLAPRFLAIAKRWEAEHRQRIANSAELKDKEPVSFSAVLMHYCGEVEAVFGIWAIPLLVAIVGLRGWGTLENYLNFRVQFTEPIFVVIVMAISGTRPVLVAAQAVVERVARSGGGSVAAWWFSILTVGPLLGSLITEPAAMTISAMLLGSIFYSLKPSNRLKYVTLGLLFVNVSIGGVLTHFAAPPVIMVAGRWGWDALYMISHFGWKAVLAILLANGTMLACFWGELRSMSLAGRPAGVEERVPWQVILVHLVFLTWTVLNAHSPNLMLLGFLFFIAFVEATQHHQFEFSLRSPLLVGFFLIGLVIHGGLQGWWIAPVISRLDETALFVGAGLLSAFNDNAAITYLASLVPSFDEGLRYAVVAGAVSGGGLTIIANAPNPAGNSILSRYFEGGISPLGLLLGALVPTIIASVAFIALP